MGPVAKKDEQQVLWSGPLLDMRNYRQCIGRELCVTEVRTLYVVLLALVPAGRCRTRGLP